MKMMTMANLVAAAILIAAGSSEGGPLGGVRRNGSGFSSGAIRRAHEASRRSIRAQRRTERQTLPAAYDYVIVVPDRLADEVAPLAEWKQKKGLKMRVVRLSWIGEDPGFDEISSYVRRLYEISPTPIRYILLAGDVGDIPPHYRERDYGDSEPSDDEWVVSDMFYGIMGEGPFADVHVGRFPASTPETMETMVEKTLAYERDPDVSDKGWFSNALLFGGDEAAGYAAPDAACERGYSEPIPSDYDVLRSLGWTVDYWGLDPTGQDISLHPYDVVCSMNEGKSLVCVYGHGRPDRVPGFRLGPESILLNNGRKLPLWISGSCNSARFDGEEHPWVGPETGRIYESERCVAEWLLEQPDKGAVGFIGCSRTGGPGGQYMFFDGCIEELMRSGRMGPILDAGKRKAYRHQQSMDEAGTCHEDACCERKRRFMIEHFNLMGDPELPIYTDRPKSFRVSVNGSPRPLRSDDRLAVEGAVVCLRRSGNEMLVGETDEKGEATFRPPSSWSRFDVTVTKSNFVPHSEVRMSLPSSRRSRPLTIKVEDASAKFSVRLDTRRAKKRTRVPSGLSSSSRRRFLGGAAK